MTQETATILSVSLGYESETWDTTHTGEPAMRQVFTDLLGPDGCRVAQGGEEYPLPADTIDDSWAADYLRDRINALLEDEHDHVRIREADDLTMLNSSFGAEVAEIMNESLDKTGSHGTRCEQRGREWHNSRSYRLVYAGGPDAGKQWPTARNPDDAYVYATVTWLCWKPEA